MSSPQLYYVASHGGFDIVDYDLTQCKGWTLAALPTLTTG
jgi:hypothetical protein